MAAPAPPLLEVALAVAFPWAAGAGVLMACGVRPRADRLAWPAWAFMIGYLPVFVMLYAASWCELPLTAGWMRAALALVAVTGVVVGLRSPPPPPEERAPASPWQRVALAAGLVLALVAITDGALDTMAEPVALGDESTNWAAKGRQIFLSGGLNARYREELALADQLPARGWHPDYPNLVPLVHLWGYVNAGRLVDFENRIPIVLFRYALLFALAGAIVTRSRAPLLPLLLPPAVGFLCHEDCGADVVCGAGFLVALDALGRFADTGARHWWRLFALAAAMLGATKHEGQIMLLALVAGAAVIWLRVPERRDGLLRGSAWLLLPAVAVASTWLFNYAYGLRNAVFGDDGEGGLLHRMALHGMERARELAPEVLGDMVGSGAESRLLHAAWIVMLIAAGRVAFSRPMAGLTTALVLAPAGILTVVLGTVYEFTWHHATAFPRVLDQGAPAVALWMAALARGLSSRFHRVLLAACIAAATAGFLAFLACSEPWKTIPRNATRATQDTEAKLADYLGSDWPLFKSVRDHSDPARPLAMVFPEDDFDHWVTWGKFSSLLYPKRVLAHMPGVSMDVTLQRFRIPYKPSLEHLGHAFDLALIGGVPSPLPMDILATGQGFVLGKVELPR